MSTALTLDWTPSLTKDASLSPELARIELKCGKIARTLDAIRDDELILLRTARDLKGIHGRLRRAMLSDARAGGWSERDTRAETALGELQQHLRRALVEYSTMSRRELHESLRHALDRAFMALDQLES